MTWLRRLICALYGHQPEAWIDIRWSVYFYCTRCHKCLAGKAVRVSRLS